MAASQGQIFLQEPSPSSWLSGKRRWRPQLRLCSGEPAWLEPGREQDAALVL